MARICWAVSFLVWIGLSTLFLPFAAYGHALGSSVEERSGPYLIDIGYEPDPLEAKRYVRFDFELWEGDARTDAVPYSYVWVRILQKERTLFAGGVHRQAVGPTTLLFTFPEDGAYTLSVSYRDEEREIASAEFPLRASPPRSEPFLSQTYAWGAAILVALVGLLAFRSARKST